jgi:hypothetical protein
MAMLQPKKKKPTSKIARDATANRNARELRMLDVPRQFRVVINSIRHHYQMVERQSGLSGAQLWALAHVAAHSGI